MPRGTTRFVEGTHRKWFVCKYLTNVEEFMLIENTFFFFYPSQFCWQSLNIKSIFVFFSNSNISGLGEGEARNGSLREVEPLQQVPKAPESLFCKGNL